MDKFIYADWAATSPVRTEVREAMEPWLWEDFGNPSTLYKEGIKAKRAVENARTRIAACLGAEPGEVIFTSGGTEADCTALWCARAAAGKGRIAVSSVEHHAVLETARAMKKADYNVDYIPCDITGHVSGTPEIAPDTAAVCVMLVNNELGTVQPVREIAAAAHKAGACFMTDAVQAAGHIKVDFKDTGADYMSVSAHKFGGPRGAGVLLVKKDAPFVPFVTGGGQERRRRAGTENTAAIAGMAVALEAAVRGMDKENTRISELSERLQTLLLRIPYAKVWGECPKLPGIMTFTFDCVRGENLSALLDQAGICVSPGAACASGDGLPSHVLRSIGLSDRLAECGVRFSLGRENTAEEVDMIAAATVKCVEKLRSMSPEWRGHAGI